LPGARGLKARPLPVEGFALLSVGGWVPGGVIRPGRWSFGRWRALDGERHPQGAVWKGSPLSPEAFGVSAQLSAPLLTVCRVAWICPGPRRARARRGRDPRSRQGVPRPRWGP
jgi:hypothetical protein